MQSIQKYSLKNLVLIKCVCARACVYTLKWTIPIKDQVMRSRWSSFSGYLGTDPFPWWGKLLRAFFQVAHAYPLQPRSDSRAKLTWLGSQWPYDAIPTWYHTVIKVKMTWDHIVKLAALNSPESYCEIKLTWKHKLIMLNSSESQEYMNHAKLTRFAQW